MLVGLYETILVLILNHDRSIADRIGGEISLYTVTQKTRHQTLIHNFAKYFSILTIFFTDGFGSKFATKCCLKGHFTLWKKPLYRRLIVFTTTF